MEENLNRSYSGKICEINGQKVDFRAEIYFDEYKEGVITIYGITNEVIEKAKCNIHSSAIMLLESKEYISIFNYFIKQQTYSTEIIENMPVVSGATLTIVSSEIIRGNKFFSVRDTFNEMIMEITDGYELIGKCPYDLNKEYMDIKMYKNIDIPIHIESTLVKTVIGDFSFEAFPKYQQGKDFFSLGFRHQIRFSPIEVITVDKFREILEKVTSFFSLLCGEAVTINKLLLNDAETVKFGSYEFIGFCNFPKEKLRALDNSGIDTTSFKRIYLFKITDFGQLEESMNYWFEHYDLLCNAQKTYSRILMDEDLKILKIDKYLAAMQLIEGFTQAYVDEEKELEEFEMRKENIISKLQDEEDKELVKNGLGFSGIAFRKAVSKYLYEGITCLEEMSKTLFNKRYDSLITKIVNDRNFYTHTSRRMTAVLGFGEAMNIATICKEMYRIIILKKMGISPLLLKYRLAHNRMAVELFKNILEIEINGEGEFSGFDKSMWWFADEK